MKRHRFTSNQLLQRMHAIDPPGRDEPVGHVFLVALTHLFKNVGIKFQWIAQPPDIRLHGPARWWRDKTSGDLIVEQG